jgi:hypothetical protein
MPTPAELVQKKRAELEEIESDLAGRAGEAIARAMMAQVLGVLSAQVAQAMSLQVSNRLPALKVAVGNIGTTVKQNAFNVFRGASFWPHLMQKQPSELHEGNLERPIAAALLSTMQQLSAVLTSFGLKPPTTLAVPEIDAALTKYVKAYNEWRDLEKKWRKSVEDDQRQQILAAWEKA